MDVLDDQLTEDEHYFQNTIFKKRLTTLAYATRVATFIIALFVVINIFYIFETYYYAPSLIKYLLYLSGLIASIIYSLKATNNILDFTNDSGNIELLDKGLKYFTRFWIILVFLILLFFLSDYIS